MINPDKHLQIGSLLFDGLDPRTRFYFVHSYAVRPADPDDVVATTTYGETFATIVAHGLVLGTQFHPEKSSGHGLALLRGFARRCVSAPARA